MQRLSDPSAAPPHPKRSTPPPHRISHRIDTQPPHTFGMVATHTPPHQKTQPPPTIRTEPTPIQPNHHQRRHTPEPSAAPPQPQKIHTPHPTTSEPPKIPPQHIRRPNHRNPLHLIYIIEPNQPPPDSVLFFAFYAFCRFYLYKLVKCRFYLLKSVAFCRFYLRIWKI